MRVAIAIGVQRVKDSALVPLPAAPKAARLFGLWAEQQGIRVRVVTDEAGAVTAAQIFDEIDCALQTPSIEQLIVYFAGHGVLRTFEAELWLLSGARRNPNEAVNVTGSLTLARGCGVPHVILVSDACRTVPSNDLLAVTGSVTFPSPGHSWTTVIDEFYAAAPGNPSYEVPTNEGHVCLFSHELISALNGVHPELTSWVGGRQVVLSKTLRTHLPDTVSRAASAVDIRLVQRPEVRANSEAPMFFSDVSHLPRSVGGAAQPNVRKSPDSESSLRQLLEFDDSSVGAIEVKDELVPVGWVDDVVDVTISHTKIGSDLIVGGTSDRWFWRHAAPADVAPPSGPALIARAVIADDFTVSQKRNWSPTATRVALQVDGNVSRFRVPVDDYPQTVLFRLSNGNGFAVPIFPGLVATVYVRAGLLKGVAYSSKLTGEDEGIAERRAFATAAAHEGRFRLPTGTNPRGKQFRSAGKLDPTLGIYAAYAFDKIGDLHSVASLANDFLEDHRSVPFDVAMLSGGIADASLVAPFFPMLSQGWFRIREDLFPEGVLALRRWLIPSALWTTFSPEGVAELAKFIQSK